MTHVRPLKSALQDACASAGLDHSGAQLIHHGGGSTIYHLPADHAVARITFGPKAAARICLTQAVTRWLVDEQNFPATRPLRDIRPVNVGANTVVGFWVYYEPDRGFTPTSGHLAELLRQLHGIEPPSGEKLPPWRPLGSLHDTISDPVLSPTLTDDDRQWLQARIATIRHQLSQMDWHLGDGLIHGDAWAGNLLPASGVGDLEVVLGDWDWVSLGPREVDLVPTWHAPRRYGKGQTWVDDFSGRYGYDLAQWKGYPVLMAMRDLVQLTGPIRRAATSPQHAAALQQRLGDIRSGNTTSTWSMIPPGHLPSTSGGS